MIPWEEPGENPLLIWCIPSTHLDSDARVSLTFCLTKKDLLELKLLWLMCFSKDLINPFKASISLLLYAAVDPIWHRGPHSWLALEERRRIKWLSWGIRPRTSMALECLRSGLRSVQFFHTYIHMHVKSVTNVVGQKCFRRSGLRSELRPMGNHSKTIYRDALWLMILGWNNRLLDAQMQ